jgi:hypothetical protein
MQRETIVDVGTIREPSAAFAQFAAWECSRELEIPMHRDDIGTVLLF